MANQCGSASIARGASTFIGAASKSSAILVPAIPATCQRPSIAENARKGNGRSTAGVRSARQAAFGHTAHTPARDASRGAVQMRHGSAVRTVAQAALHLHGVHRARNVPLANTVWCAQRAHGDVNRAPPAAFSSTLGCQGRASARAALSESIRMALMGRVRAHPSRALLASTESSCRPAKTVQWDALALGAPCIRARSASSRVT